MCLKILCAQTCLYLIILRDTCSCAFHSISGTTMFLENDESTLFVNTGTPYLIQEIIIPCMFNIFYDCIYSSVVSGRSDHLTSCRVAPPPLVFALPGVGVARSSTNQQTRPTVSTIRLIAILVHQHKNCFIIGYRVYQLHLLRLDMNENVSRKIMVDSSQKRKNFDLCA